MSILTTESGIDASQSKYIRVVHKNHFKNYKEVETIISQTFYRIHTKQIKYNGVSNDKKVLKY